MKTNVEILDRRCGASGGYKVDVSRGDHKTAGYPRRGLRRLLSAACATPAAGHTAVDGTRTPHHRHPRD